MPIPKKPRKCPVCDKTFKPMKDNQWKVVKYEHDLMSLRHKKRLT